MSYIGTFAIETSCTKGRHEQSRKLSCLFLEREDE